MSIKQNIKKNAIYKCSICGKEISEYEDEWIGSFPRCPKCNQNTMISKNKGEITDMGKGVIRINHCLYANSFFHRYQKDANYDKETNTLYFTINLESIYQEMSEKIAYQCKIQNTPLPKIELKMDDN